MRPSSLTSKPLYSTSPLSGTSSVFNNNTTRPSPSSSIRSNSPTWSRSSTPPPNRMSWSPSSSSMTTLSSPGSPRRSTSPSLMNRRPNSPTTVTAKTLSNADARCMSPKKNNIFSSPYKTPIESSRSQSPEPKKYEVKPAVSRDRIGSLYMKKVGITEYVNHIWMLTK
jgi:hypothetical protein